MGQAHRSPEKAESDRENKDMKKFMVAFTTIAAGFATQHGATADNRLTSESARPENGRALSSAQRDLGKVSVSGSSGDLFNFTLKKSSESGQWLAWHESHSSHASHESHSSHYSSYNSGG